MCADACGEPHADETLLNLIPEEQLDKWPANIVQLVQQITALRIRYLTGRSVLGMGSKTEVKTYVNSHWRTVAASESANLRISHSQ